MYQTKYEYFHRKQSAVYILSYVVENRNLKHKKKQQQNTCKNIKYEHL